MVPGGAPVGRHQRIGILGRGLTAQPRRPGRSTRLRHRLRQPLQFREGRPEITEPFESAEKSAPGRRDAGRVAVVPAQRVGEESLGHATRPVLAVEQRGGPQRRGPHLFECRALDGPAQARRERGGAGGIGRQLLERRRRGGQARHAGQGFACFH